MECGAFTLPLLLLLHFVVECDSKGYCSFPSYLWQPLFVDTNSDGSVKPRHWISKSEYYKNTNKWRKQKDIVASNTTIWIHHKIHASCDGYHQSSDDRCYKKTVEYKLICVSEAAGGKFRIQQEVDGRDKKRCILVSAVPKEENEDTLCLDRALQRDEWPWIAADILGVQPCPFTGGFDFTAFEQTQRKNRICADEWRPSRLESECVEGEAISFYSPSEDCSLFYDRPTNVKLQCWGHWEEESYLFILMGEKSHLPRFVLRLSKDFGVSSGAETVYLYFSLVMPLGGHGNAPGTVQYNELRVQRSGGFSIDFSHPQIWSHLLPLQPEHKPPRTPSPLV
ncbi:hypothetical protein CAPTEDRAFT_212892 [Capitella teleta]|uniref:Uncharacterized protein n=1 Tax=Capitella teleta TaxID=283909 RepID=R7TI13_CAPTE|nr:hypothetical protein CAPTEDRAFT_212892 [Capitella teleta]|eukprot:ELT93349.1 hypothetical protein CAPTEDRAFT_212892 [Capitella teleta]